MLGKVGSEKERGCKAQEGDLSKVVCRKYPDCERGSSRERAVAGIEYSGAMSSFHKGEFLEILQ